MRPIRPAVVVALALALWTADARAGDDFAAGEYKGNNGQGSAVKFAADPTGVHVFSTRLRLSCGDGEQRRQRVWIAHVDLTLDGGTGQFAYDRRRGSRDVLRVTGTLSGMVASGTVLRRRGRCSSGIRPWTAVATGQGMHDHHSDPRLMAGNIAPYPALELASARNRQRAEALRAATIAAAPLYATVALAESKGYIADPSITPIYRPGVVHYRKHGPSFWGRVLEPRRPQALIFWCPPAGECSLAAFMYRVPADRRPPTYGGILGWHRHGMRGTWMTHVWLTGDVRSALAQCVPFNAVTAFNPLVVYEPYRADVPDIDEPCPDTVGYAPGG